MTDGGFRLFYRIVKSNPPALADFESNEAKGRPDLSTDEARRYVWDGISVFSTQRQARRKQRTSPGIGRYVAVLRVPLDGSIRFERTLRDDGHHTIWADAAELMALVVSVESP